jgi:hypothetical protein
MEGFRQKSERLASKSNSQSDGGACVQQHIFLIYIFSAKNRMQKYEKFTRIDVTESSCQNLAVLYVKSVNNREEERQQILKRRHKVSPEKDLKNPLTTVRSHLHLAIVRTKRIMYNPVAASPFPANISIFYSPRS